MLHNMLRAAAGRDRIPTDGLVAHYTMDNVSGTTVFDETGSWDATNLGGATQVPGVIGQAFSFDGVDDRLSLSGGTPILNNTSYTISLWANIPTLNQNNNFVRLFSQGSTAIDGRWVSIEIGSSGSNTIGTAIDDNATRSFASASGEITVGSWMHVCAVCNRGVDLKIYVNNDLKASGSDSTSGTYAGSYGAYIGSGVQNSDSTDYCVNADIDIVRVYERNLSEEEITQLYNEGA